MRHHDGRFWFVTTNLSDFDGRPADRAPPTTRPARGRDPVRVPEAHRHRPRPGLGRRRHVLPDLEGHGLQRRASSASARPGVDLDDRRAVRVAPRPLWQGSGLAGSPKVRTCTGRRPVVPAARRGRHRARARRHRRPRAVSPSGPVRRLPGQPDPDPPQHRPSGAEHRPRRPGPARRTEPGRPSISASDRAGPDPGSTSSAGRRSWPGSTGWTAGRWSTRTGSPPRRTTPASSTTSPVRSSISAGSARR